MVRGRYPQREDVQLTALDRAAQRAIGLAQQWSRQGVGRFRHALEAVGRHERELRALPTGALSERSAELRRRLGSEGLVPENVARAFALVRELAERTLDMRPFDVQVIGGWVMLQGMIAEMQTGEGKTLAATLPASAAALCGIPVHVVTVNDYLVTRDAEWTRPLYEALGLTVGSITEGMAHEERRQAYACDVTYCTNKQIVFDYLRDRLVLGERVGRLQLQLEGLLADEPRSDRLLMRGLCCAIVDEADSVLVDEARTPLILSRGGSSDDQARIYEEALGVARRLREREDFVLHDREIELTDRGREQLRELAQPLGGIWTGERRRAELGRLALSALYLFERDRHYLVKDDKVQIIDEYTGRLMPDRSWERGLHQLIEVKEGCDVTAHHETLARISYQRYFRRYLLLCGMTGTAKEVAGELRSIYQLGVVKVPTRLPLRRERQGSRVFRSATARWSAVVARIGELRAAGRPVLVGTRSVEASERLSGLLAEAGLPHRVLNARQDEREAEVVAEAGQPGQVTVATNMAGRGTDIRLGAGVSALGGLHVIATERHDAGRIDRQLFGRCGRQGDPGSFEFILSLEDELVESFYPRFLLRWLRSSDGRGGPVPRLLGEAVAVLAQRAAEMRHARARRSLMKLDEHVSDLLAFSGRRE